MDQAPAIPRLGVPAYGWWNESLHGVARAGVATVFPQAIGLAATFDVPLIGEMAEVIGNEARAKHHQFVRDGKRGRYQGLTFWSPNINIFRDPALGARPGDLRRRPVSHRPDRRRVREGTAGRRPAVLPGDRHREALRRAQRARARPPHVRRQAERARPVGHLPAGVPRSRAGRARASVMSAYNRINGESATASARFLNDILRTQWGFTGYVVSDCGAVDDIFRRHKLVRDGRGGLGAGRDAGLRPRVRERVPRAQGRAGAGPREGGGHRRRAWCACSPPA